jgi:hypothetical protein
MIWVGNDKLFNIHDISDEQQVDKEKTNKEPVQFALAKGDYLFVHDSSPDISKFLTCVHTL